MNLMTTINWNRTKQTKQNYVYILQATLFVQNI